MIDDAGAAGDDRPGPRAYGFGAGAASSDPRPLIAIDVDGVIALDDPTVPFTAYDVKAWGKWRREVLIADGTTELVGALAERCELAWATPWSYDAHEALRHPLSLPTTPWAFLPAQFHAEAAIAGYAAGRHWAWITESAVAPGRSRCKGGGLIVAVDPRRGLPSIDADGLLRELGVAG